MEIPSATFNWLKGVEKTTGVGTEDPVTTHWDRKFREIDGLKPIKN